MSDQAFVVEATDLNKQFGETRAVQDLSLKIPRGKITCLLGPSASGKTTLIRMMLGIYVPDSGTLTVLGRPSLQIARSDYRELGYMPQFFVLYPHLNILENMAFVGRLYGLPFWRRGKRIRELLEFLELWEDRRTLATNLSGGMQRRVALASALIHEPEILFLDEPTAGLDPILRAKLWEEFHRLNDAGKTLIVTTQYVAEAENADRVAMLSEGRLVADDTPEALRRQAFGGDVVEVETEGQTGFTASLMAELRDQEGVISLESPGYDQLRFALADGGATLPRILELLKSHGFAIDSAESVVPTFDQVFVRLVETHRASHTLATGD
jgi:ABC-2 type transport system ATP-binding protein